MIRGRVQGVGYRWWTRETALGLGLTGWVRNRVEARSKRSPPARHPRSSRFIKACHEGPRMAKVTAVEVVDVASADAGGPGFEQRPTAEWPVGRRRMKTAGSPV